MATLGLGFYAGVPGGIPVNGSHHVVMDPPAVHPLPGRQIIGRVPPQDGGDGWEYEFVKRGEQGGRDYAAYCLPFWLKAQYVLCWLGPNEPLANTRADAAVLCAFYIGFCAVAHEHGVKVAGGVFSRGRPDENILDAYLPMLRVIDFLAVHEYGYPETGMWAPNDQGWLCFRYRRFFPYLKQIANPPKILVTEVGLDEGTGQGAGWAGKVDSASYAAQLQWYMEKAGGEIVGAVLFCKTGYGWDSFKPTPDLEKRIWELNSHMEASPPPVYVPDPPTVVAADLVLPVVHWPLPAGMGTITQEYGEKSPRYTALGLDCHNGRDISAALGTPVLAPIAGVCWPYADTTGYGLTVEVWAPEIGGKARYKALVAHLSAFTSKLGQVVQAGQQVGKVGSTGNSTGAHVHLGVKPLRSAGGVAVYQDPGVRGWQDPRFWMVT